MRVLLSVTEWVQDQPLVLTLRILLWPLKLCWNAIDSLSDKVTDRLSKPPCVAPYVACSQSADRSAMHAWSPATAMDDACDLRRAGRCRLQHSSSGGTR